MKLFLTFLLGAVFVFLAAGSSTAATFTVTVTADSNDGTCDSNCSLREAVAAATAAAGDDTIVFDPMVFGTPQTITLGGSEIVLGTNGSTTITGPGAALLTISGNNASRIFSTGIGVVASISGVKLTMGNGAGALNTGRGGAVYNASGTLTLDRVIVTGNSAANGGGINNAAQTGGGGGVLTITDSIISDNTSTSSGGGLQNFSTSAVTIKNSTFSGNMGGSTTGGGGAQFNGTVRVTNTTFANNTATAGAGGGFQSNGSNQVFTNVTVSGNTSVTNGGGIHRGTTNVNFFIRNSIIAGNNGVSTSPDVTNSTGGISSEGNNVIGNTGTSTGWIASDLQNVNPMLGMLSANGGPTPTMVPMPGSPAINAGQNCVVDLSCPANNPPEAVTTDQRGFARQSGGTVDIGSVETTPLSAAVSGRLSTPGGSPVSNVLVVLSEVPPVASGVTVTISARTNSFGFFKIENVPTGRTYSVNILAKQFTVTSSTVTVNDNVTNLNLVTNGENFAEPDSVEEKSSVSFK